MHPEITLDDFLHRRYENERECEYIDGYLLERTGGEMAHSRLHAEVGYWFSQHRDEWNIHVAMSYSMWTSPTRIRVPDLVIMDDNLRENIRITPPLLCVEILAPEDTLLSLCKRCNDFLTMGTRNIWLFDPMERVAYTYTGHGMRLVETNRIAVTDSPVFIDLPTIFADEE